MRTAFVVLVGLCALALATPPAQRKYTVEDKDFLLKQKQVLKLFNYVNQPSYYADQVEYANKWTFEGKYAEAFTKPEYVKEFHYYYEKDAILDQGEVFSVFYQEHLEQAIYLFKSFYYAKDFETLYQFASWARQNVNEGLYIYALSVAIVHRPDTQGIVLPPIYEVYPYYFFNNEVISKAQQYKQAYWPEEDEIKDSSFKGYIVPANYSGWYLNVHPEQSLSYFTEDVGINAYYYYFNIYYPFWMDGEEFKLTQERRGEQYYYVYQQLLARYYLERLSNDMGEIPFFSYDKPLETGYWPSLSYPNGLSFPSRPSQASPYYKAVHGQQYINDDNFTSSYTYIKDYQRRIRDAIDMGYVWSDDGKMVKLTTKDGIEMLGNLIESNPDSPNSQFYGDLQIYARHFLGFSFYPLDETKVQPSALEHFETSLRDPMFWQMYKQIVFLFQKYKSILPSYTEDELTFDGVKVDGMTVERLITYFEYFYSDISNAVYVDNKEFNEDSFEVRARQFRLNHKPFNYKIDVTSDKAVEAFVKVFIGPKYDEFGREIDMDQNRMNFVEFDRFTTTLVSGKNVIERNSRQSFYGADRTSFIDMYKRVMTGQGFNMDGSESFWAFPNRFLLPKGKVGGQTYQFFVIVSQYHGSQKVQDTVYPTVGSGNYYVDNYYPLGYPFDREVDEAYFDEVPNSYFQDVVIYHKNMENIDTTYSNQ